MADNNKEKENLTIKSWRNKIDKYKERLKKIKEDTKNNHRSEIKTLEEEIKKCEDKIAFIKAKESSNVIKEAANIEDEIKPIIDKLNNKGYKTKYSSPGHEKLRKKTDREPDGVYHGKLYSDARIMFDGNYDFPSAPKYWAWKNIDGCSYLDIVPINYNDSDGTPDEAFNKWKNNYMASLTEFVDKLKDADSKNTDELKDEKEDDSISKESVNAIIDREYAYMKELCGITD